MLFKKGERRGQLSPAQVRMILRIYWTDKYIRLAAGKVRSTNGLPDRMAKQFGVGRKTIERIMEIGHDHNDRERKRYPGISLSSIQRAVKVQLRRRGIIE